MTPKKLIKRVQACLHPGLLKLAYRKQLPSVPAAQRPLFGHCSAASEAIYFLLGGKGSRWTPTTVRVDGGTHWYLRDKKTGEVLDPTADQFVCPVPYGEGRGCGFPTPGAVPSKRAKEIMACVRRGSKT